MIQVVGIDEAGYGPNLGPLVQAAAAIRLPTDDPAGWATLATQVRRTHERGADRLLIDDSKKVYAGANGLEKLCAGVLGGLGVSALSLGELLKTHGLPLALPDAEAESWFDPAEPLTAGPPPVEPRFTLRLNVVQPTRFNRIVATAKSKAVVLSRGVIELMQAIPITEPTAFVCDKQGGRNFYGPLLSEAFPDGWVVPEKESAVESRYRVLNLPADVSVVFRPRADGDSIAVAFASMACKLMREVCMGQFNRYWAKHVPGLAPTAGYPVDAKRFYAEIEPAMAALITSVESVWRQK